MEIQNLKNSPLDDIVFAILMAFEGYFVTMPTETSYWENRFQAARVDLNLSFGIYDNGNLVAFIINGIDERNGKKTAFNTGTGVLPPYRGKQLVDQLYAHALPILKKNNVQQCALEVIQENARAIRVYERIGFHQIKNYACFKGKLPPSKRISSIKKEAKVAIDNPFHHFYAWDNTNSAIEHAKQGTYEKYTVFNSKEELIGFFVINPNSGYLPQFEILNNNSADWDLIFDAITQVSRDIKINNIDTQRIVLSKKLLELGFENSVNQFEMEWAI